MNNKNFVMIIVAVFLIVSVPLLFANKKENTGENKTEPELYVEQIWFKNIEMLNNIPIDQSLLIQDEITYYFQNKNEHVEEVELIEGSLKEFGDYRLEFQIKYEKGVLNINVDKDKVTINE